MSVIVNENIPDSDKSFIIDRGGSYTKPGSIVSTKTLNLCLDCHKTYGCGKNHDPNLHDVGACEMCGKTNELINCVIANKVEMSGVEISDYMAGEGERISNVGRSVDEVIKEIKDYYADKELWKTPGSYKFCKSNKNY